MTNVKKVFIDGSTGTTGLHLSERLSKREDVRLITLPEDLLKDESARREALNRADIAFLCLPNEAALQAAEMIENDDTAVIDTSSSHRTLPGWAYGFPELKGFREAIKRSKRIANPGCHASGFIALVAPLVQSNVLSAQAKLSCFSLTGYSSNGKTSIRCYEAAERDALLTGARLYGLAQRHKHLREMRRICGLEYEPILCPVLNPYYSGTEVIVPVFAEELAVAPEELGDIYRSYYSEGLVKYAEDPVEPWVIPAERGYLSSYAFAGRDDMQVTVAGNGERVLLIARYDNLGKGACGAAIQNMNLLLGVAEDTGLVTTGGPYRRA